MAAAIFRLRTLVVPDPGRPRVWLVASHTRGETALPSLSQCIRSCDRREGIYAVRCLPHGIHGEFLQVAIISCRRG
jgi:hypothetical protein